jgi:hypothetical protein
MWRVVSNPKIRPRKQGGLDPASPETNINTLDDSNQIVVKEGFTVTDFINVQLRCAWSNFVRQLSGSSLRTEHFNHNMQRRHTRFVRLS